MECPFCAEAIKDEAMVCRYCQREVGPFRPLLKRLASLEAKLSEYGETVSVQMNERVDAMDRKLDSLREHLEGAFTAAPEQQAVPEPSVAMHPVTAILIFVFLPVGLLLMAHATTVLLYDLPTWVLRVISILLPVPFGFWLAHTLKRALWADFLVAIIVGGSAVAGMSQVLAWHDNISAMPQDIREWREVIEYAASIAFSYLTGTFLGRWVVSRREARQSPGKLAQELARMMTGQEQPSKDALNNLQDKVQKLNNLVNYLVPAVTALVSIVTGLKGLTG